MDNEETTQQDNEAVKNALIVAVSLIGSFWLGRKSVRIPVPPIPAFPESATLLGQAVIITMSDGVRYFADFAESDWTFAQKLGSVVGKK